MKQVAGVVIEWCCEVWGDQGSVVGYFGSAFDLSPYVPRVKCVAWGFDEQERRLLTRATTHIPNLRAVIARARPHAEVSGLLIVEATVRELDQMYTLVEDLSDTPRGRRRIEVLDELRRTLCSAMDGF